MRALDTDGRIYRSADDAESLVTRTDQSFDQPARALRLIAANRIDRSVVQRSVEKHERHVSALNHLDLRARQASGLHDPIDLILQNLIQQDVDIALVLQRE